MWEALDRIKTLVTGVDSSATRYFGRSEGAYTVWCEYELDGLFGGDSYAEPKWRVLIERFTKTEDDTVVLGLMSALAAADGVTFQYSVRRNRDQEIIYHAWDCEVC